MEIKDMVAEIDLMKNGIYYVSDGVLTDIKLPPFAEIYIRIQNEKVFEVEKREKIRSNGQNMV